MTHTTSPTDTPADGTWPGREHHVPVADTSMLPGTETAPPAAVSALHRAAQGAHRTIDRLADSAAPKVRHLSQTVGACTGSLRSTVRSNPLVSVLAAMVLGGLMSQIARPRQ